MNHTRVLILLLWALTLQFCHAAVPVENGISYELATERRAKISDLKYSLRFNIPESQNDTITGNACISFNYIPNKSCNLQLDFRENADKIKSVKTNGEILPWKFEKEHIVIDDSLLINGNNKIEISFLPGQRSLNRNNDYIYTLFVPDRARTAFPCFDQPDMKASFQLTLEIPAEWKAVSNTYINKTDTTSNGQRIRVSFAPTEPLSTYLFAFATGRFNYAEHSFDGRKIGAYYRETDTMKIAQLSDIFKEVEQALKWLENYTAIKYPFAKYDLVVLPGFQFGGMEHTGATFYNANSLFLSKHPTPDEILRRTTLIAHETAHMWFGDYVTMKWFNDVWTKEVFANYYAAAIARQMLPEFDHDLEWMRQYAAKAMSEDRSMGGTAIRQQLDNMNNAGLIYNQIIYNKAPVMLAKLVEIMNEDAFRDGIREYLTTYAFGNATWDNLIDILQRHTDADIKKFSHVWVYQPGMPVIKSFIENRTLYTVQTDSRGNGNNYPQKFKTAVADSDSTYTFEIAMTSADSIVSTPLPSCLNLKNAIIIPNYNGRGYGTFTTTTGNLKKLANIATSLPLMAKFSTLTNLNENYLLKNIPAEEWATLCCKILKKESDRQTAASLTNYIASPLSEASPDTRKKIETELFCLAKKHPLKSCRTSILRLLSSHAYTGEICDSMFNIWQMQSTQLLSERDYINLSYQLALRYPDKAKNIISTQRSRISDPDRLREFDFISPAAITNPAVTDSIFQSLLIADNRKTEPWAAHVLSLLNHPLKTGKSAQLIKPALEILPDIQRTGDIFFPANWCSSLLSNHKSVEAAIALKEFLNENPGINPLLRNKILNGAYPLIRLNPEIFQ